jgi:hypothetical protein
MKLSVIAARLRKIALDMEAVAARTNDLDFPDEMVPPFVANAFTDDNALRVFMEPQKNRGKDRQSGQKGSRLNRRTRRASLSCARLCEVLGGYND